MVIPGGEGKKLFTTLVGAIIRVGATIRVNTVYVNGKYICFFTQLYLISMWGRIFLPPCHFWHKWHTLKYVPEHLAGQCIMLHNYERRVANNLGFIRP